jgi:dTDP-glucose 4,6-dehydratase
MQALLVTGAAGFIGSNFVRMLVKRGEPVRIIAFDQLT